MAGESQGTLGRVITTVVAVLLSAILATAFACDSKAPPPPQPLSGSPSTGPQPAPQPSPASDTGDSSDDDDDGSDSDGKDGKDEGEGEADGEPAQTEFNYGGAEIGDEATKKKAKECIEKGTFFDRFANDTEGECTKTKLAKLDCTLEGIKKVMSDAVKTSFEEALETDDYKDKKLDQCLDCPPDNSITHCKNNSDGKQKVGTRFFFITDGNGDQLTGNAMTFTIRPNQE